MTRYILEKATGYTTGSAYSDDRLTRGGFKGEGAVDGLLAVKTHEPHRGGKVRVSALVDRGIFISRDPYAAMVSYYEHLVTKSHTSSLRQRLVRHDSLASREFMVWSVEILQEVVRTYEFWVRLQDIRQKQLRKKQEMQDIPDRAVVTTSETAARAGRLEMLWVRYEDITDERERRNEKEVLRILEFLGLSPTRFARRVRCAVQHQDDLVYRPKTNVTEAPRRLTSLQPGDASQDAPTDQSPQDDDATADMEPIAPASPPLEGKCAAMHETDQCIANVVIDELERSSHPDAFRLAQMARDEGRAHAWPPVLDNALGSAGITSELSHGALENMTLCHSHIRACIQKDCYLRYYPARYLFRSLVSMDFRQILRRFDYRPSLLAVTEEATLLHHLKDAIKGRAGRPESRERAAELFAAGVQSTAQCPEVLRKLGTPPVSLTRPAPAADAARDARDVGWQQLNAYMSQVNARREQLRRAARERMLRRRAMLRARSLG